MCLARFFGGVGGLGGVISDIYLSKDRNTPMVIFAGAALFGTGLGPLYTGFIAQHASWRWVFYSQAILCGFALLSLAVFFPETRGSVLLSQKAKALNDYYEALEQQGVVGVRVPLEDAAPEKELLFTEAVVFFFSLWVAFAWAVLYLQFGSIPLGFEKVYGFSLEQSGAVFSAICVGTLIAVFLSILQDTLFVRYFPERAATPEGRLYFTCVATLLLPGGLFWFGWTLRPSIPWIVPAMGIACATIGIFSIYVACFNFLADAYHSYASSALAAQSCCRNLLGGIFPLVTRALFNNLGFPAASSLLGGIGCLLSLVPWALVLYGPQIRARSKIASQIMKQPSGPD
ncbi:hypothetical protein KEM52_005926 [Ascosphaera acerosa]|nr:hypothetical protein KEM52_005926 [Ascosphaera acerosa]